MFLFERCQAYLAKNHDVTAIEDPETGRMWFITEATEEQRALFNVSRRSWTQIPRGALSAVLTAVEIPRPRLPSPARILRAVR